MEDTNFFEEHNSDAAALAFTDYRAETYEECLDVLPGDVRAGRVCEDCFQSPLMRAFHVRMVPEDGTERNTGGF